MVLANLILPTTSPGARPSHRRRLGLVKQSGRPRAHDLTTRAAKQPSSVSQSKRTEYDFTYDGNDGRKKATFEQAFKDGVNDDLQDRLHAAPWEFSYQMGEKYLEWGEELQQKLYARVASDELNITEGELVEYLNRLRLLMPDASEKLANMPIKTLARLIRSIDDIPMKLMRIKAIFPRANASLLAIRNPELVLGFDSDHLQWIADELNEMFPKLEVDKLVEENPSMLDIEELRVAMAEAQRIMPSLDLQKAVSSGRTAFGAPSLALPDPLIHSRIAFARSPDGERSTAGAVLPAWHAADPVRSRVP